MESRYQKWITLSYLAVSGLLSYLLLAFSEQLISFFDLETRLKNVEILSRVFSIGLGFLVFLVLQTHSKVNVFMDEVMEELSKVTWPSQDDTFRSTWIVLVMVLVSGLILGFLDSLWTRLLGTVL